MRLPVTCLLCTLLLGAALFAAPVAAGPPGAEATAPKRPRLVLLDFTANGVDPSTVKTITDVVSSAFAGHPTLDVVSATDLRALVDVETARQTSDCPGDADACMADIASALGADLVVHGSVGQLGALTVVNLSIFDAARNNAVAREKVESSDPAALSTLLESAVNRMAGQVGAGSSASVLPALLQVSGGVVAVVGIAAAVLGGLGASSSFGALEDPTTSRDAKDEALDEYPLQLSATIGGAVISAVGIGLIAGSFFVGAEP